MLRGNEFFYEQDETPQFMVQTTARQLIRDPKLFTANPTAPPAKPASVEKEKNKPIVLSVSICCSSCVDIIDADFRKVTGFKSADCDIFRKKVTVTGTATLADVLSAARRHFKDAEVDLRLFGAQLSTLQSVLSNLDVACQGKFVMLRHLTQD